MIYIDLNCDLGEGIGLDAQIMPYISSCNIACCGHYGDRSSIQDAIELARHHQVKVGAHPSFNDKENFGRVRLDWDRSRFRESVTNQLLLFTSMAKAANVQLHHIKMHGALYHATAHEKSYATWLVELLQEDYPYTPIYSLPNTLLQRLCTQKNQPFIAEAFADRAYQKDGSLVGRNEKGAVHDQVAVVIKQIISLANNHKVKTLNGVEIDVAVDTFCIHGDNLKLVMHLPELVEALKENNIAIAK